MNQQEANSDLFDSDPDKHKNWQTHTAVHNVVQDRVQEIFKNPAMQGFMKQFQQKFPDFGNKTHDGQLLDGSIFAIYERGFQLLRRSEGVEGEPGFVETVLEPHQVKVLRARIEATDYSNYSFLQRDLQYLKLLPKPTEE